MESTVTRVPQHTDPQINERIREETIADVELYANAPTRQLARRLEQLDEEWTSERVLETNAASLVLLGSFMAIVRGRRLWALLPLVVGYFLMQHAVQGWCPPLSVIRAIGFRTEQEVDAERAALIRVATHPETTTDAETMLREAGWTT